MRRRKVWLLVGVLLLGVAGAGVYLCVFPDDPPPAPPLRAGTTGTEVQEVMAVVGLGWLCWSDLCMVSRERHGRRGGS